MIILGIGDSSSNDTFPTTDWSKAAAMGCKFAVIRASTTGAWNYALAKPTVIEDVRWKGNYVGASTAGLKIFPYCWFDPRPQLTPDEQAVIFLNAVKYAVIDRPIVDMEPGSNILYNAASLERLKIWLTLVETTLRQKPAIYSYPSYIDSLATLADISWMKDHPWFNAHWDVTAPRDPWPWYPGAHMLWQYTASMPGARYGFNAVDKFHSAPRICMAVMEGLTE